MLRRFLCLSVGALALVVMLGAPGQLHAQRMRVTFPTRVAPMVRGGFMPGFRGGFMPGFRGGFMPGFRGGFSTPRFNGGFFTPRFNGGFFAPPFSMGFSPGFFRPF